MRVEETSASIHFIIHTGMGWVDKVNLIKLFDNLTCKILKTSLSDILWGDDGSSGGNCENDGSSICLVVVADQGLFSGSRRWGLGNRVSVNTG